jgi:CRP/FNR family transcriptional regulator, anaerobic regulatory protein
MASALMPDSENGSKQSIPLQEELALGRRKLLAIFRSSPRYTLQAGVSLVTAPCSSEGVYHLRAGWACQVRDWSVGRRAIVDVYLPGDVIGLDTVLRSRAADQILTLTSVTIEAIPRQDVLMEVFGYRPAALYISWLMGQRLRRVDRLLAGMSGLDARGRLAMMLLDFYLRLRQRRLINGLLYNLPLTQMQIGFYLGLTVVHINRLLRALRDERIASLEKHCVTIIDLARLTSLARNVERASPGGDIAELALHGAVDLAVTTGRERLPITR